MEDITDKIRQLIYEVSGEYYLKDITLKVDNDEWCLELELNQ